MKTTSRIVRVSIPYIQEVMASKDEFDALAFCLFVKLNLTSSEIHNAKVRRLKQVTHMGSDRLKRIINFCVERGMITVKNDILKVNKLSQDGGCLYKFRYTYKKRNKRRKLIFGLTLAKVKDMLRRAVVANHVRKVENIREQSLLTLHPATTKEYRKGKRFVRKLSVWGLDFYISNGRLADIANCSLSKLRTIKASMIKYGELERIYSNTFVCKDEKLINACSYNKYYREGSFLFKTKNGVYRHNPNIYNYKGNNILLVVPKTGM